MSDDRRPAESAAPPAAVESAGGDTLSSSDLLSRRSTDFGLGRGGGPSRPDPLLGRDLGGVLIERLLAQGGMGRVYAARQRSPARTVAVKVMRPSRRSPAAVSRFQRESDLLGRLRHPAIADVYLAGSCLIDGEETPYFVMEFVPGAETLVEACDRRRLDVRRRLEVYLDVCRAVAHGHACGVVHRDLKPGNILVDGEGRPKVIDFGVARVADGAGDEVTETGEFVGTRRYSSPEQCDGRPVDARTDVHALGIILHELLTGRLPYDVAGRSLTETAGIVREQPAASLKVADRSLGGGLALIADRCLAKRPADRYPTAGELADDVQRLLAGEPLHARPRGPLSATVNWCRRHRMLTAGVAAATAAALAIGLSRWPGRPSAAGPGPTARFPAVSSLRTTPLQWLGVSFDEPVRSLSIADFRLTRDGRDVPLSAATVTGERGQWEIRGLDRATAAEGRYVLELVGTGTTPVDRAGRRLAAPASVTWRMPPYREVAFDLLGDEWRRHVVSMTDVECVTERNAGSATFIRPTTPNREGAVVLRFEAPFEIRAATLEAPIAVWTTGDPFPYDPRARAALDVSADGVTWINLDTREANRGGFGGGPFDVGGVVGGRREVWVRARLAAERPWPDDGLIHAQFLRSDPADRRNVFRLTLTGPNPERHRPPPGTPAAEG